MTDAQSNFIPNDNSEVSKYNIAIAITELQAQQESLKQKVEDLNIKSEATNIALKAKIESIEKNIAEVRDQARDAMHISVGVDGKNGLRGSMQSLLDDVSSMSESLQVLKQTANDYAEMKTLLLRLFAASAMTIICQFGGAVWFVSSLHSRQESMREDLNRVLTILDKRFDDSPKVIVK